MATPIKKPLTEGRSSQGTKRTLTEKVANKNGDKRHPREESCRAKSRRGTCGSGLQAYQAQAAQDQAAPAV